VIVAPPLFDGADHDADQFKFVPLSSEEAVNELTVPGAVLKVETTTLDSASEDVPPMFVADANALK
jgi:hypothetical protein